MTEEITIKVSKELLKLSGLSKEELEEKNNLLIIFELYQQGKVSLSKGASLAGIKVDVFLEEFRKRRLLRQGGPTSAEEAEREYKGINKLQG